MADLYYNPGVAVGQIATSATTAVGIIKNTYTEQTTNAQRSFKSSSANDAAAGTGARTLTLTYLDQNMAGPFTETITMNGTAAVNTVSTTICFIEDITVATVGSGGQNAGTITLFAAAAGGGGAITTLVAADNKTKMALHYVPTGKTCYLTDIAISELVDAATAGGTSWIAIKPLGSFERDLTARYKYIGNVSGLVIPFITPIQVTGPARLLQYTGPEAVTANTHYGQFNYFEL